MDSQANPVMGNPGSNPPEVAAALTDTEPEPSNGNLEAGKGDNIPSIIEDNCNSDARSLLVP